jgi:hypothetical protein
VTVQLRCLASSLRTMGPFGRTFLILLCCCASGCVWLRNACVRSMVVNNRCMLGLLSQPLRAATRAHR